MGGTPLRRCLPTAFGLGPRLLKAIFLSLSESKRSDQSKSIGVFAGLDIITSPSERGVTPCDTSHDVVPTPDFSGSDDETKAQALARGPYRMIRWTDGAEGGRDRPGRPRRCDIRADFAVCHVFLPLQVEFQNSAFESV
ncbi:hypothetical protein THAOC_26632 [Thalassiosira oceanica]|uniref:Uncharacterized protein n=1 Tax=Thalassiosira oceanica TaxID=159749 RepID=K0RNL5_THAOC|nr:hypothetical protein THAOC_26632 [Thalassiosira oceanica]|eukprot:EJK53849.1 hypothetical protein THAOC_26632 [Thalassiosira oceanica]